MDVEFEIFVRYKVTDILAEVKNIKQYPVGYTLFPKRGIDSLLTEKCDLVNNNITPILRCKTLDDITKILQKMQAANNNMEKNLGRHAFSPDPLGPRIAQALDNVNYAKSHAYDAGHGKITIYYQYTCIIL